LHYVSNNKNNIVPISSTYSEYKILFQDVIINDNSKYIDKNEIINLWKLSNHILNFIDYNNIFYYEKPMNMNYSMNYNIHS